MKLFLRFFIFFFFFLTAALLVADVPVRREQFIYSILAFNGTDYAGTFCTEDSDTIYLIANVDNFISARKTLVYYWPITGDWKTDTSALNQPFDGTLELSGKDIEPEILAQTRYTYYNIQGEYELNWKVAKEEEAEEAWQHYQGLIDAYWNAVQEYQQAKSVFDLLLRELTKKITELREEGKDFSKLLETVRSMKSPQQPEFPKDYIVPPGPVQRAFILNLPVGEYSIRFRIEDGTVMEGSERTIVMFEKRRARGIGLELIPGDKWTRPVESKTPSSVLYVDGTTDLYLRPFFQIEFNDLYYEKMKKNDSKGNPNLMKWVRIQQVPQARFELTDSERNTVMILEEPFYVEQAKGSALGYKILPYDPEGAHKDRDPSLKAFHVPIDQEKRVVHVRVKDKNGLYLAGGKRQIRVVTKSRLEIVLILLAIVPVLVMLIVLIKRSRKYSSRS